MNSRLIGEAATCHHVLGVNTMQALRRSYLLSQILPHQLEHSPANYSFFCREYSKFFLLSFPLPFLQFVFLYIPYSSRATAPVGDPTFDIRFPASNLTAYCSQVQLSAFIQRNRSRICADLGIQKIVRQWSALRSWEMCSGVRATALPDPMTMCRMSPSRSGEELPLASVLASLYSSKVR